MEFPENLEIEVTLNDISNGWPGSWRQCPIALALNRAIGQSNLVPCVSAIGIRLYDGELTYDRRNLKVAYLHDIQTRDFIARFDGYGPRNVLPFKTVLKRV